MQVGRAEQLREQGSRYLIRPGDLGHCALDALVQPCLHDPLDTALGIHIRTSHTLHRVASGWWEVVMNLHNARAITILPPPEVSSELSTGI